MELVELLRAQAPHWATLRRDIHAHPELAFEETRTAGVIASHLQAAGLDVHTGIGGTGVVGVLRCGSSSKAIGLRADMDALPLEEANDFAHRSRHAGRMHACGHDGHVAMLVGTAEHLASTKQFDGTVVFIFQPAEEGEGGAQAMIDDGLFTRFPVDAVFGLHNWPGMPIGTMGVIDGPVMAGADRFDIVVKGRGAHAAMPHQGIDTIVAASYLVQAIQTISSRSVDPLEAVVVSVTQFHAGDAYNVLPAEARLMGTVRAFRPEVQSHAEARLRQLCTGVAMTYGADISFEYLRGYPPTVNTTAEAEHCRDTAVELFGESSVMTDLRPSMGAEDFAYFLHHRPGCYVWLGNGPGEGGCHLHSPRFDFNDEIIPLGVAYWTRLIQRFLAK